jgi:hypothetical protein
MGRVVPYSHSAVRHVPSTRAWQGKALPNEAAQTGEIGTDVVVRMPARGARAVLGWQSRACTRGNENQWMTPRRPHQIPPP